MNTTDHSMPPGQNLRGRPAKAALTLRLQQAMVTSLAVQGFASTRLDDLARAAKTSKQAIYRRWPDKLAFAKASLSQALHSLLPPPPERGTVARDLYRLVKFYETELFGQDTGQALLRLRTDPAFAEICADLEQEQRFAIRQILIATPFEAGMEDRANLLIALIWHRAFTAPAKGPLTPDPALENALYLILGLSPVPGRTSTASFTRTTAKRCIAP